MDLKKLNKQSEKVSEDIQQLTQMLHQLIGKTLIINETKKRQKVVGGHIDVDGFVELHMNDGCVYSISELSDPKQHLYLVDNQNTNLVFLNEYRTKK